MPHAMPLLRRSAVGTPDLRPVAIHQFAHHDGAAGRRGAMDDRVARVKHPLKGVAALDPRSARRSCRRRRPLPDEGRRSPHRARARRLPAIAAAVHQTPLADRQAEQIGEGALQALVGQGLEGLQIGRHRMDARPEGRADRGRRHRRDRQRPAGKALHRKPSVSLDEGTDLGQIDRLVLADGLGRKIARQAGLAAEAPAGAVVDDAMEILAQRTAVTFVSGLGAAGLRLVTPLLAIRGGRLRRRPRRLLRPLQPQHQLDQFVLRKPLQITAIHTAMDPGFRHGGKGVGNYIRPTIFSDEYLKSIGFMVYSNEVAFMAAEWVT